GHLGLGTSSSSKSRNCRCALEVASPPRDNLRLFRDFRVEFSRCFPDHERNQRGGVPIGHHRASFRSWSSASTALPLSCGRGRVQKSFGNLPLPRFNRPCRSSSASRASSALGGAYLTRRTRK